MQPHNRFYSSKLSKLQREVLRLAMLGRADGRGRRDEPHVYFFEVLHSVHGFPVAPRQFLNEFGLVRLGGKMLEERPGYASASASLSRSVRRLVERGLTERHGAGKARGVRLTALGVKAAREHR